MADQKITQLTEKTIPTSADLLAIVDESGTPTTKRSLIGNMPFTQIYNVKAYGAVGNGSTNDITAIQAAIDAASSAGGGIVFFPAGTYIVNTAIAPKTKVNLQGTGQSSVISCNTTNSLIAFPAGGANAFYIFNLRMTASGGHIFDLTAGGCSQVDIKRCWMYQASSDKAVWYNNASGNGTLELLVEDNDIYVAGATRSVPAWYMIDNESFGNTNANRFINNLCTYGDSCNNAYFFHLEAAIDSDYIYDNQFIGNTFELCLGGCIKLLSTFNAYLQGNKLWPEGGVCAAAFISLAKSTATGALSPTANKIVDSMRLGGTLDTGIQDILLTGNCRQTTIENFRCSPDAGKIDLASSTDVFLYGISGGTTISNAAGAQTVKIASGGAITANTMALNTDLPITEGGTGSSTAAAARTALGVIGYSMHVEAGQVSPADGATVYFGGNYAVNTSSNGSATIARLYIPSAGTITKVFLNFHNSGVLGTSETSSIYVRLNDTSDTLISNAVTNDAVNTVFNNTALTITVAAGDYFVIKWVAPTWSTNPTNVRLNATVYIE